MLPKVTLLKEAWSNYSFAFGRHILVFEGGLPTQVPVAVALELKKKMKVDGSPLFEIVDLPKIIQAESVVREEKTVVSQNVNGSIFLQLRLEGWHSNA